jgi:hypothetical protein
LVIASPRGSRTTPKIVLTTVFVPVSMTVTEPERAFATYRRVPLGVSASAQGSVPTGMCRLGAETVWFGRSTSITVTVPPTVLAT